MTLFPDWQLVHPPSPYPLRLRQMHAVHGQGPSGKTCGQCQHLRTKRMGGTYFKCDQTVMTDGAATDWRKRWPACGLFEPFQETPNATR
jgi:hypothetical protein